MADSQSRENTVGQVSIDRRGLGIVEEKANSKRKHDFQENPDSPTNILCDALSDVPESRPQDQLEIVKKHEAAKQLQQNVKSWLQSQDYLIETAIQHPERKLVIYIPCDDQGKQFRTDLIKKFPDIEGEALIKNLKSEERKTLYMNPTNVEESCLDAETEIVEKYKAAKQLQQSVKAWLQSQGYLIETGIRVPERKVVIYIPCNDQRKRIQTELIERFPDIKDKALIERLKIGERKRLSINPGRTPILFGDGGSATLGTFVRDAASTEQLPQYALSSYHGNFPIQGRDVFVTIQGTQGVYRLGRVVENIFQASPVIDACLIEIDEAMRDRLDMSMYINDPEPALYLKMHEHAEHLGLATGTSTENKELKVAKFSYGTKVTGGKIVEYSRDLVLNGVLLTDNIVTKHENEGMSFAGEGDSGAIVYRPVRFYSMVDGKKAGFYGAISLLYLSDSVTKESFSFPLPRCLASFGQAIEKNLELATEMLYKK